ncbi:MAG: ROK family protein, partial [Candidatus Latescibacteria bacterium]|nr:ROK family protein [Candidatus Latescibacterota bacterium]
TDRSGGADWMIERILEAGRKLLSRSPGKVSACGIAFGGPVDFGAQRIVNSTHVAGWDDVALPEIVGRELKLRAVVDNDANVGALGEFTFGAGAGIRNLVYYNIGTGIGGGIIVDGQIYRGSDGNAGELGHCPILPDGPLCDCGNRGCLESLCSGKSIGNRAAEMVRRHPRRGRAILACGDGEVSARAVFDAARQTDGLAQEIVDETCRYLGMSAATAMNAFAPDAIVVGGNVSKAGRVLFDPLREQASRYVMPVHRPHLKIKRAKLGGKSQLLGAVALAKMKCIEN